MNMHPRKYLGNNFFIFRYYVLLPELLSDVGDAKFSFSGGVNIRLGFMGSSMLCIL